MSSTDTTTRARRRVLLRDPATALDLVFVLVLSGLALSGLASSFTGLEFLVVGLTGVVLAIAVTHAARMLHWPLVAPVVILAVVFFVLGGPLCLRSIGDTAFLPGGTTLGAVADQAIYGWKDLLTTLPPVDGDGPLLVLPWLLGLVSGCGGTALSGVRLRRSWVGALLPVLGLTLVLVVVILLGVRHPQSVALQGSVFAAAALGWLAVRARRSSATVHGTRGPARVALGALLVIAASALAMPVSALVTGDADDGRAVVRSWVEPPFDIGRYPSPLAGFRKYVDLRPQSDPANVFEKTLFTIHGAPPGSRVRIATMDAYDGMVWGASNDALPGVADDSFQRVSSTIDNPVAGKSIQASVTVGDGYDGVWLPTIGALQGVHFESGEPGEKAESFRYNLATSTAVVPSGVHRGDTYSFTAVQPEDKLDEQTLAATTLAPIPGTGFLQQPSIDWAGEATTPMGRVLAIAEHLRSEGKYSDGVTKAEQVYHPGHNLLRLSDDFINDQQMVGNDEQYAAVMALLANEVHVPARVVLGAIVPDDGVVTGADVKAWVELGAADGSWRTLDTDRFMSTEPPAQKLPETNTPMSGTVVPPPAPIPPPSDAGEQSDADLNERKAKKDDKEVSPDKSLVEQMPNWLVSATKYVGGPLLVTVAVLGGIVGLKALRRRRRRRTASMSARVVGAWRELVDHARDLGQSVPVGSHVTRREQSGSIRSQSAPALARSADRFVFGPTAPAAEGAAAYWETVTSERRAMSLAVSRRRRLLAAINLASLRRRPPS